MVPGAVLVIVAVGILAGTWSAVMANHPAYQLTLLASVVLGLALVASGARSRPAVSGGALRTTLRVLAAASVIGLAAMLVWLKPFLASSEALQAFGSSPGVAISDSRTATVYEPETPASAGLVLYGGARVDPRAYAVLAGRIAAKGYRVVVLKCPFDLQLLCPDAASAYVDDSIPWAVGGHSLGGVAASSYAGSNAAVDGLVLWASFPVADISGRTGLAVSSITGSADGLSTPAKVAERVPLLPADTLFVEIPGAIHSFFGDYGLQPDDGVATISREAAQDQIVAATVALLSRISAP